MCDIWSVNSLYTFSSTIPLIVSDYGGQILERERERGDAVG
jgi:hypothetical protein